MDLVPMLLAIQDWHTYNDFKIESNLSLTAPSTDIKAAFDGALGLVEKDTSAAELNSSASALLLNVFRSWRQSLDSEDAAAAPPLLACLLNLTYERALELTATSLVEPDRSLLCQIAPVAKACGFDLHLCSVAYAEMGPAVPVVGGFQSVNFHDKSTYPGDLEMCRVEEKCLQFSDVTNLDGMPMQMSGSAIERLHACVDGLQDLWVVHGTVNDGERDTSFTQSTGMLTCAYERNALIITPSSSSSVVFTLRDTEWACTALEASCSASATLKDQYLVESLQTWLLHNKATGQTDTSAATRVIHTLRDIAFHWREAGTFVRALRCSKMATMGSSDLIRAYDLFGWVKLKDVYTEGLSHTTSDFQDQLVARLKTTARDRADLELLSWCEALEADVVGSFRKLEISGLDNLMDLLESKPEPTACFRDIIVTRLHTVQPGDLPVWTALLTRFHSLSKAEKSKWDFSAHPNIIQQCLRLVGTCLPLYSFTRDRFDPTQKNFSIRRILAFLTLGAELDAISGCAPFLERLWNQREAQLRNCPQCPPWKYYSALVIPLHELINTYPQCAEHLQEFFCRAAAILLPMFPDHEDKVLVALSSSMRPMDIVEVYLTRDTVSHLPSETLKKFAIFLFKWIRPRIPLAPGYQGRVNALLRLCLAGMIDKFEMDKWISASRFQFIRMFVQRENPGNPALAIPKCAAVHLLRLCVGLGQPSATQLVFNRFLADPKANEAQYIKEALVHLLKKLPDEFLKQRNLTLADQPYASFASNVVQKYTTYVLGMKPKQEVSQAELEAVGCGCHTCQNCLVSFMTTDKIEKEFKANQTERSHVEHQLARMPTKWGVTWMTIRDGSPHTLKIIKSRSMAACAKWQKHQHDGLELMEVLGSCDQQKSILGANYQRVQKMLAGEAPTPLSAIPVNGAQPEKHPLEDGISGPTKKTKLS